MIFHCGQCQAKYQLPDERVAGKTVRMKCRKCSHLIEVKGPEKAKEEGGPLASEGWYAGIAGKPTGPMSAADLAKKVDEGALDRDALVWREGQDGWKPFHTFADLVALTVPAKAEPPAQASEPPGPPETEPEPLASSRVAPPSSVARSSTPGIPRPPASRPSTPLARGSSGSAAPKLEPTGDLAPKPEPATTDARPASEPVSEPPRLKLVAEAAPEAPLVAPEPAPKPDEPSPLFAPTPPEVAPLAAIGSAALAAAPSPASEALEEPARAESRVVAVATPRPERGRVHPAAWAIVGLGGVLVGIFAGLSMGGDKGQQQPEPVAVSAPQATEPEPAATAEEPKTEAPAAEEATETEPAAESPVEEPTGEPKAEPEKTVAAATPAKPKATAATSTAPSKAPAPPAMTGLSNLSGLTAGPTAGPSKAGGAGGKGALSHAEVERVVQSHRAFVKRRCWELALATKTQGAPSSARVATTITIAPDGRVTNASATGGEGYPGLASCVAGQVRGWKFPPSEGGTVNVPFVFAAQ